jgi:hypothetical protein
MSHHKYVIVGGGMTAASAIQGIREADRCGTVAIISDEKNPRYDRHEELMVEACPYCTCDVPPSVNVCPSCHAVKAPLWRVDSGIFIVFLLACLTWLLFGLWPAVAGLVLAHYRTPQAGVGICIAALGGLVMLFGTRIIWYLYLLGIAERWCRAQGACAK